MQPFRGGPDTRLMEADPRSWGYVNLQVLS